MTDGPVEWESAPKVVVTSGVFYFLGRLQTKLRRVLDKGSQFELIRELDGRPDVVPVLLASIQSQIQDLTILHDYIKRYASRRGKL